MRLHYLQHVPFEGLGLIAEWARERGHTVTVTRMYAGDPLPPADAFDLLVVLGGPMSVNDGPALPWLSGEMAFLSRALERGTPTLGICLGAQMIAAVLGGTIGRSKEREIGWFPIFLSDGGDANPLSPLLSLGEHPTVFHWHGETFTLPEGATPLASSPGCTNQAFTLVGQPQVLALQFHIETTPEAVTALLENAGAGELNPGPYISEPGAMQEAAPRLSQQLRAPLYQILDTWSKAGVADR